MNAINKRICIIRFYYFPGEAHLRRDVKALLDHDFDVDVICAKEPSQRTFEKWYGVNIYRLPIGHHRTGTARYLYEYMGFSILAFIRITTLFFKNRYASVEVDTMPDFLVFSAFVPKLFKARIILYLFENMKQLYTAKHHVSRSHPVARMLGFIENMSCRFAHEVLITYHRKDMKRFNTDIILNVPGEEFETPVEPRYTRDRVVDLKNVKIVTHSTLTEVYGIQDIIRAMPMINEKFSNAILTIIGDGEYRPDLLALAKELGIENRVVFKGFVPFQELATELTKHDIGVVSILSDHLLPNKLFEYVALKIPVVCADQAPIRDIFTDNEITYYRSHDHKDLADKITVVRNNYSRALKCSGSAYGKYHADYAWVTMKKRYVASHISIGERNHS